MDDEAKASDLVTLTRFLLAEKNDHEMTMLMQSIQLACKVIASAVRKAGECRLSSPSPRIYARLARAVRCSGLPHVTLRVGRADVAAPRLSRRSHACAVGMDIPVVRVRLW